MKHKVLRGLEMLCRLPDEFAETAERRGLNGGPIRAKAADLVEAALREFVNALSPGRRSRKAKRKGARRA